MRQTARRVAVGRARGRGRSRTGARAPRKRPGLRPRFRLFPEKPPPAPTPVRPAAPKPRKRFWLAAGELFALEVVPYGHNRYAANHEDYALISWDLHPRQPPDAGLTFDNDKFTTNQLGHTIRRRPLLQRGPRTNGYSFWESALVRPAAGSYVWEMAARDAAPLAQRLREHDARRDGVGRGDVPALADASRRPRARRRPRPPGDGARLS